MSFVPTYLYVKEHAITGKCYFGKTTSKDPIKYLGSGLHWSPHIKNHGKENVKTLWYKLFTDQEDCTEFAEFFSEEMDIVNSDRWLNMKPENGLDGGSQDPEHQRKWQSAGTIAAIISPNHFSKNPENLKNLEKMRIASSNSPTSSRNDPELQMKWRAAAIASPNAPSKNPEVMKRIQAASLASSNHNSRIEVICPHCGKRGIKLNMSRWHFDKCKDL